MKWICHQWTNKIGEGWTSSFDAFSTREEAIEHGEIFQRYFRYGDLDRVYEVYEDIYA